MDAMDILGSLLGGKSRSGSPAGNILKDIFGGSVRDLAWDVPRGMEEQAYTVSLIAMELDEQKEADYLADLCQGLRMDPARCNEIHRSFGAPVIFQG